VDGDARACIAGENIRDAILVIEVIETKDVRRQEQCDGSDESWRLWL
jgi:hypothetical protein